MTSSPKEKTIVLIVLDVKEEENESEVLTKDVVEVKVVDSVETEVEIEIVREMTEIRIRVKNSNLLLMNPNLIRRWRVIGENAKIKS